MKCRINYNDSGVLESVDNLQGERSKLFDKISQVTGDKNKALDIYALTETPEFMAVQSSKRSKILDNNKRRNLDNTARFAESIGATPTNRPGVFRYTNGNSSYFFKSAGNNTVGDGLIETPAADRGKGYAKALMQDFVKKAGANGLNVRMVVAPRDASTTEKGLKSFYKSLGFQFDGTDFEMIRRPKRSDSLEDSQPIVLQPIISIPVEPELEEVMTYALKQDGVLTNQDHVDVQNTLNSLGLNSYSQFISALERGLVNNGVMVFTEASLVKSGIFNKYERNSILNSLEIQDNIRRVYQALKNSDDVIIETVDPLFVIPTANINSLGKQAILNPYTVEQDVTKIIAGKDLEVSIDDIPYDSIKNNSAARAQLQAIADSNRVIPVKTLDMREVVDKTQNTYRELFEQTIDTAARDAVNPIVDYLKSISEGVWMQTQDSIYTLLKDFNTKAINGGVDFMDLQDKVYTKSQEEIIELLDGFQDLMNNPSENNLDYFFDVYSDFFEVPQEPVTRAIETQDDQSMVLDTNTSEYILFDDFGLLKQSEGIYQEVEPIRDVEEAYAILFENKDKMPNGIETLEELKEHVRGLMKNYQTNDFEMNQADLENLIIHKIYFSSPVTSQVAQDRQAAVKASYFNGDYEYLTKVYPSDFYKQSIREKRKNSELWKNLYSHFDINDKGIILKSNDPMTLRQIEPYITEELAMYNLISKNLNLPVSLNDVSDNLDQMQYRREYAISNPDSVPKIQGDFAIISPETIAVKNEVNPIVKTPAGLFEIDYQDGNISFYNKLPQGNRNYNSYGQHRVKTDSSVDVRNITGLSTTPEVFFTAKNYYSKSELEEINKNFFEC